MNRHQLALLRAWLNSPRRKPLVIRGARQVGKSTLVELFSETVGRDLVAVDLERHADLAAAFQQSQGARGHPSQGSNDPSALLNLVGAITNQRFGARSLLFIDEIQAAPAALSVLRYFREEMPHLPVLAAGSLLEFALAERASPMPVGRIDYLHMTPMTFTEFLQATGKERLAEQITAFEWPPNAEPTIAPAIHQRLLDALRLYQFVGGMPEAVQAYAESGDLGAASAVHASIIDTYRDDFPKYAARRDMTRLLRVFNFAARQGGRKVKYSNVSPDDRGTAVRQDIDLLALARVVAKVTHSHCSSLPLQADMKDTAFKLIFLDVGLMNAICGLNWQTIATQNDVDWINAGASAEQFIGQHLQYLLAGRPNRELTYWLREGRANNAEVDYVVDFGGRIVPIEVKAGRAGRLKSLHQFVAEKDTELAIRFDANPPSSQTVTADVRRGSGMQQARYRLLSLPLYLVERAEAIVGAF